MSLPKQYEFLDKEGAPKMLVEFLKIYGVVEVPGNGDNATILLWAKELGLEKTYNHDKMPWCGLEMAVVCKNAGKPYPDNPLWALNWAKWGERAEEAKLGYILVFPRFSNGRLVGGHVGMYVGQDDDCYHVAGGNEGDKSDIVRIKKDRVYAIRKPMYLTGEPANVRVIKLGKEGPISSNEA